MNAYLCTYRRRWPSLSERRQTALAAEGDPLLLKFLESYDDSFYDWGDDPSFFAAHHLLGNVCKASWGVCRPDVRRTLKENDLVVFFCGCQSKDKHTWHYFFIGFGTVRERVEPRAALWRQSRYAPYRKFYNVLARLDNGRLTQSETFLPYHDNWKHRARAPYVLFDPARSAFNLDSPHHVATWDSKTAPPETWKRDVTTREIERLLFVGRGIDRRLRTSSTGYGHAKLNLLRKVSAASHDRNLSEMTKALRQLV
jgi:hypothetical protein